MLPVRYTTKYVFLEKDINKNHNEEISLFQFPSGSKTHVAAQLAQVASLATLTFDWQLGIVLPVNMTPIDF